MKVEISDTLKHDYSSAIVSLPKLSQGYSEVYSLLAAGSFISGAIKFNSRSVMIKIEIDGTIFTELNLSDFRHDFGQSRTAQDDKNPIFFNKSDYILNIGFFTPIFFKDSVKIFAMANSNSSSRKMEAYQTFYTILG